MTGPNVNDEGRDLCGLGQRTVKETAQLLSCTERQVNILVRAGKLVKVKWGDTPQSAARITTESIRAFTQSRIDAAQAENG